jgi:hypothetical protein
MAQNRFMTAKERSYVADCIRRNMKYFKSEINYSALFCSGKMPKIDISAGEEGSKKVLSLVFGKEAKKSSRRPRETFGLSMEDLSSFLQSKMMLEELIDLYTIQSFCNIDEEELRKSTDAFGASFKKNFIRFVAVGKFFDFLRGYFLEEAEEQRMEVVMLLQKTFHLIGDVSAFYVFISAAVNKIPVVPANSLEPGFVPAFLSFPSGMILATALLIQNEELAPIFHNAVVCEPTTRYVQGKYAWQFLAMLVTALDEQRQRSIVEKMHPTLRQIIGSRDRDRIEEISVFLKAIGVDPEEI